MNWERSIAAGSYNKLGIPLLFVTSNLWKISLNSYNSVLKEPFSSTGSTRLRRSTTQLLIFQFQECLIVNTLTYAAVILRVLNSIMLICIQLTYLLLLACVCYNFFDEQEKEGKVNVRTSVYGLCETWGAVYHQLFCVTNHD